MTKLKNISNKNIIITGFMGTGKTIAGMLVARGLNRAFIDLDVFIESETGKSISYLFKRYGESHFRNMEHLLFRSILATNKMVIATGGGTLVEKRNAMLTKKSIVFCLTAGFNDLKKRLNGCRHRPLIQNDDVKESIKKLLGERQSAYNRILNQINTSDKNPEEVAACIIKSFMELDGNANEN